MCKRSLDSEFEVLGIKDENITFIDTSVVKFYDYISENFDKKINKTKIDDNS